MADVVDIKAIVVMEPKNMYMIFRVQNLLVLVVYSLRVEDM